jgi:PEP-CTERM motif
MFRKAAICGAIVASVAWATPASAAFIAFDPSGGGSTALKIDLLDPAPGNSITIDGGLAGLTSPTFDGNVEVLFQANLAIADSSLTAGADYANGQQGHFFTFVAGSQQLVTGTGTTSTTVFDPASATALPSTTNYFYIYTTTVATDIVSPVTGPNDLSGVCFTCGTLILSGVITSSSSSFTADATQANPALDLFGTNNYPGVTTLTGTGGFNATIKVTSANALFFPDVISGQFINWSAQTKTNLPYQQVDPSKCFSLTGLASCTYNGAGFANIGATNGEFKDIMLSQDAAISFTGVPAAIPEPATLTLLGAGLLAAARRRLLGRKK